MFFEAVESTQIIKMYISLDVFIKFTSKVYYICIYLPHNEQYASVLSQIVFIATYIHLNCVWYIYL